MEEKINNIKIKNMTKEEILEAIKYVLGELKSRNHLRDHNLIPELEKRIDNTNDLLQFCSEKLSKEMEQFDNMNRPDEKSIWRDMVKKGNDMPRLDLLLNELDGLEKKTADKAK